MSIKTSTASSPQRPFRGAVVRGLAVALPPLLTVVILVWVWDTIHTNVLSPVLKIVSHGVAWQIADIRTELTDPKPVKNDKTGHVYQSVGNYYYEVGEGAFVPYEVYESFHIAHPGQPIPSDARVLYREFVTIKYLKPWVVLPVLFCVFILAMYLAGKFMAAGVGRFLWGLIERIISSVPMVRSVYSSVKQVTDFTLRQTTFEYTRIVAIEYPRKGLWSLGFVTGESFVDVNDITREPMASVYLPSSPAPFTGYTVVVPRREVVDLNLTLDQSLQYVVSCGVVIPSAEMQQQQRDRLLASRRNTGKTPASALHEEESSAGRARVAPPTVDELDGFAGNS